MDKNLYDLLFPKLTERSNVVEVLPIFTDLEGNKGYKKSDEYFVDNEFLLRYRPEIEIEGSILAGAKAAVMFDWNYALVYGINPEHDDKAALEYITELDNQAKAARKAYDSKRFLLAGGISAAGGIIGTGIASLINDDTEILGAGLLMGTIMGFNIGYPLQKKTVPGKKTEKFKQASKKVLETYEIHKPVIGRSYIANESDKMYEHKKDFILDNLSEKFPDLERSLLWSAKRLYYYGDEPDNDDVEYLVNEFDLKPSQAIKITIAVNSLENEIEKRYDALLKNAIRNSV